MYCEKKVKYLDEVNFKDWIFKIRNYLTNGWNGEDPADFYVDIEENYPIVIGLNGEENWKSKMMGIFIEQIREICEETEPMHYKEQDEKLRYLMEEFGYM